MMDHNRDPQQPAAETAAPTPEPKIPENGTPTAAAEVPAAKPPTDDAPAAVAAVEPTDEPVPEAKPPVDNPEPAAVGQAASDVIALPASFADPVKVAEVPAVTAEQPAIDMAAKTPVDSTQPESVKPAESDQPASAPEQPAPDAPVDSQSVTPAKPADAQPEVAVKPAEPAQPVAARPVDTAPLEDKSGADGVGTAPLEEPPKSEGSGTAPLEEKPKAEGVGTGPLDEEPTARASGTMRVVTVTDQSAELTGKTDNLPPEPKPDTSEGSGEISLVETPPARDTSPGVLSHETDTSLFRTTPKQDAPPTGAVLTPHRAADPDDNASTGVLPARQSGRRSAQSERDIPLDLVQMSGQRELVLLVRGMVERLMLEEKTPVTLGRTDVKSRTIPDVDLTPYGALDRGVSREHATLQIAGDRILVTDLGSTNGTFVAGLRLPPNTPAELHKGDELMLGRLAIQVLFR
jgi:hypothetical protein